MSITHQLADAMRTDRWNELLSYARQCAGEVDLAALVPVYEEFIQALEEDFAVTLTATEIKRIETLDDAIGIVKSKLDSP